MNWLVAVLAFASHSPSADAQDANLVIVDATLHGIEQADGSPHAINT